MEQMNKQQIEQITLNVIKQLTKNSVKKQTVKPVVNKFEENQSKLVVFMKGRGYDLLSIKNYERQDKKPTNAKILKFSNNKEYFVNDFIYKRL